jgi:hypothetical protein
MTSAPRLETITLWLLRIKISVVVGQPTSGTPGAEVVTSPCASADKILMSTRAHEMNQERCGA